MNCLRIFLPIIVALLTPFLSASAASFTLVIDPGHGGHDPGAVGATAKEKTINLNVALAFGKLVEQNCPGIKVVYTRKTDVFVSLQERANIANRAKANLFISIHTNAAEKGSNAIGAETYTLGMHRAAENLAVAKRENSVITKESNYKQRYQGFDPNKAESYIIFELMQDKYMAQSVKLAKAIQQQYAAAGRRDKGVHQAGFLVLRETSMPSVLTELGFISHPTEEGFLASKDGVDKMAQSLYKGFSHYRKQVASLDDPTENPDAPLLAMSDAALPEHFNEGATPETPEDVVPTIRPVKVVPYNSTSGNTQSQTQTPAEPAKQEEPIKAVEPTKPEEPAKQDTAKKPEEPAKQETIQKPEEPAKQETIQKPEEPAKQETAKKPEEPAKQETAKKPEEPAKQETVKKPEEPAKQEAAKKPEEPAKKPEEPAKKPEEPAKKPEEPAKKPEEPAKQEAPKEAAPTGKPEFRLQLFTTQIEKKSDDPAFKGLETDYYKDGTTFKYTYGKSANYDEIVKLKQTLIDKFPGVFIIALIDGKRIDLQEAIKLSK